MGQVYYCPHRCGYAAVDSDDIDDHCELDHQEDDDHEPVRT